MNSREELTERLTRFYREAGRDVPTTTPAWEARDRQRVLWRPVLASAAIVAFAAAVFIGVRTARQGNPPRAATQQAICTSPSAVSSSTPTPMGQVPNAPRLGFGGIGFDKADCYTLLVLSQQTGEMSSSDFTWKWDGSAWHLAGLSPGEPTSNLVYDPAISKTVMLVPCGGCDGTWAWDGSSWSILTTSSPFSGVLAFDEARNNLVAFDGSQTWTFDGRTWTRAHPSASPPQRFLTSMAYDPRTRTVLLYGGLHNLQLSVEQRNDTWAWDGTNWTQLHPQTTPGGGKAYLAYDTGSGQMSLLQQQIDQHGKPADLSSWTWTGSNWVRLRTSPLPTPFDDAVLAYDQKQRQMVLMETGGFTGSTWIYANGGWHRVQLTPEPRFTPAPRVTPSPSATATTTVAPSPIGAQAGVPHLGYGQALHAIGFDEAHGYILLVTSEPTGDMKSGLFTWKWDGSAWRQIGPGPAGDPGYPPSSDPSSNLAYDPAISKTVMLAGCVMGCPQQTWAWDGSTWSKIDTPSSPPATGDDQYLAFDKARNTLVLFRTRSTTWTFDGHTWTQRHPSSSPPGRGYSSMAYDPRSRTILLYGGISATSDAPLNDTWAWDGTTWKEMNPATIPGPGGRSQLAFDAGDGQMVMVQLHPVSGRSAELSTWTWDGSNWATIHSTQVPGSADFAAVAYDSRLQRVVLLETRAMNQPAISSTWTYANGQWQQVQ